MIYLKEENLSWHILFKNKHLKYFPLSGIKKLPLENPVTVRTHQWIGVLDMTLNSICWRNSSSGDLEGVENPFIVSTLRSTLTQSGRICCIPIHKSTKSIKRLYLFDRTYGKKEKKNLKRDNYTKMYIWM